MALTRIQREAVKQLPILYLLIATRHNNPAQHSTRHELYAAQQQSNSWRSTVNTILHKKCAWKHAAQAIMLYGLPTLEHPERPDDATEHINALGQFVENLAKWLKSFASSMHAYKQTEGYQQEVQRSSAALENRMRRAAESH